MAAQNGESIDTDSDDNEEIEAPKNTTDVQSIIFDNRIIILPDGFCEFTDRYLEPKELQEEVISKKQNVDSNQSNGCCAIQ